MPTIPDNTDSLPATPDNRFGDDELVIGWSDSTEAKSILFYIIPNFIENFMILNIQTPNPLVKSKTKKLDKMPFIKLVLSKRFNSFETKLIYNQIIKKVEKNGNKI